VFGEDDLRSRGVTVYHDQRIADGHVERIALRPGRTVLILIRRPASICAFDAFPTLVGARTEDQLGIIGVKVSEALRVLATEVVVVTRDQVTDLRAVDQRLPGDRLVGAYRRKAQAKRCGAEASP